jgi:hypothetical protein
MPPLIGPERGSWLHWRGMQRIVIDALFLALQNDKLAYLCLLPLRSYTSFKSDVFSLESTYEYAASPVERAEVRMLSLECGCTG